MSRNICPMHRLWIGFVFCLGLVIETEIQSAEDGRFFHATLEQYVKQVSVAITFSGKDSGENVKTCQRKIKHKVKSKV